MRIDCPPNFGQAVSDALSGPDAPLAAAEIPRRADFSVALLRGRPLAAMRPDGAVALAYRRTGGGVRRSGARARVLNGGVAMADRPRLEMVDDLLAPVRTAQREPEAEEDGAAEEQPRPSARRAARKPLQGSSAACRASSRGASRAWSSLEAEWARVSRQDVLAALLWRHGDHTNPASVRAMHELPDEYETAPEAGTTGR